MLLTESEKLRKSIINSSDMTLEKVILGGFSLLTSKLIREATILIFAIASRVTEVALDKPPVKSPLDKTGY